MIKQKDNIKAILDIGSSKVIIMIVELQEEAYPKILGYGYQSSEGFKSGAVTDFKKLEGSIISALSAAEKMAGVHIEKVFINISATEQFSKVINTKFSNASNKIDEKLIAKIDSTILNNNKIEGFELIYQDNINYAIDGKWGIKNPLNMVASEIGVKSTLIYAPTNSIINLANCLTSCNLTAEGFISTAYASMLGALSEDEMQIGTVLLDMGAGTTSIAICKDQGLIYIAHIPVGSMHITSDIACGLSVGLANAERVKTLFGSVMTTSLDDKEIIEVPQIGEKGDSEEVCSITRAILISIIVPRIEEILEMARDKIIEAGYGHFLTRRLVVTGGAAQIYGMREFIAEKMGVNVRIASNIYPGLDQDNTRQQGYAFTTGIGMMKHVAKICRKAPTPQKLGFIGRLIDKLLKLAE